MADQPPKTGKPPTQAKAAATAKAAPAVKAPTREMVVDESGVMRFVTLPKVKAKSTAKAPTLPPTTTVAATVAPAVAPSVAATVAPAVAPAVAPYRPSIITPATATATAEEDDEIIFDNEGEIVTGETKVKVLAELKAKEAAAAAVAATKVPVKAREPRKTTDVVMFKTISDVEKMKLFYKYREKNPILYTYTAEGNLEIKQGASGLPPSVIPLRAFSPLRPEEFEEVETKKKEAQKIVEEDYVQKMKELRQAYTDYNPRDPDSALRVVRLNEALREASVLRNRIVYPERWCKKIENPAIQDILLNKPYEERKMGYDISLFKRFGTSRRDAFGHYREHGEMMTQGMKGGEIVVLYITNVDDSKTGQFHPANEREFDHNETRYASPYQAYETERFKELDNEGMVKKLLGTRSEKTIRNLVANEPDQPQNPLQLWEEILESLYTQHKDLAEALKATGSARFHIRDKQVAPPEYANALVTVRTKLKEREDDAPSGGGVVKQSVITKEQQEKAKVGAIVHSRRNA